MMLFLENDAYQHCSFLLSIVSISPVCLMFNDILSDSMQDSLAEVWYLTLSLRMVGDGCQKHDIHVDNKCCKKESGYTGG